MTNKYKNKYRISSIRLQRWNYSNKAAYFVTICTFNKEKFFCKILDTQCSISKVEVQFTEIGKIVQSEWTKTPSIRPDMNLTLGDYVVMPNHFHGIIIIGKNNYNQKIQNEEYNHQFGPQRKNLSSIIRGFKSAVTKQARLINPNFSWQSGFHEHIIRNENSYNMIVNYIINNPLKWNEDRYYIST